MIVALVALGAVALVFLAIALRSSPTGSDSGSSSPSRSLPADARLFAPTSFWNAALSPDAPLDSHSQPYVADLLRQLVSSGRWINTTKYSYPVYTVSSDQQRVPVVLDASSPDPQTTDLRQAFAQGVPIPPDAVAAAGTDQHMIIWQPATDTMWEFWGATRLGNAWHARWGGRIQTVSTSPGYYTAPHSQWGATSTSLPALGGLIRISELRAGHIDHALSMAIPNARAGAFVWPAQRTDGNVNSGTAIPEGTRFRIDPQLDLSKLAMPRIVRTIAQAAQRYGIVVQDRGGSVSFYAQDPTPTHTNPYIGPGGLFEGQSPAGLLGQFPWGHLEVLAPPAHPGT
jgi:hypothetical protein